MLVLTRKAGEKIKIGDNKVGGYEGMVKYVEDTNYNGTGFTL